MLVLVILLLHYRPFIVPTLPIPELRTGQALRLFGGPSPFLLP
jgi:hypothetical protein